MISKGHFFDLADNLFPCRWGVSSFEYGTRRRREALGAQLGEKMKEFSSSGLHMESEEPLRSSRSLLTERAEWKTVFEITFSAFYLLISTH